MPKFAVQIDEIQSDIYIIEAENYQKAEEKIKTAYRNGTIIIDTEGYFDVDFKPLDNFGKKAIDPNDRRLEYYKEYNEEK